VIELIVVLGLCLCSLAVAALLGRWLATRRVGAYEVQRLLGAVARAGTDFLWQEGRLLGASLLLVALAVSSPLVLYRTTAGSPEQIGWTVMGLCLGAGAGALVAYAAFVAAVGVTSRVVEAVRTDLNEAGSSTLRGSALIALLTDTASLLLTLLVLAIPAWYLGQSPVQQKTPWLLASLRLLPATALGAVAAAAVFQLGGANFHTAAGVAGLAARRQDSSLVTDRDKNPALVAELVGDYVGAVAARVTDYFAALVLANSAMLLVSVWVHVNNPGTGTWALVALPLVVRAVGLIASALALFSVRFETSQNTWRTLTGAALSTTLITVVGLFGASLWLVGESAYLLYFGAGTLGVLANSVPIGLTYLRLRRDGYLQRKIVRSDVVRSDVVQAAELRLEAPAARALGLGLQQTWSLIVGVGLCILAAWLLGTRSDLAGGGPLALAVMLAGLLSVSAFGLTQSLFARVAESSRSIAALNRSQIDAAGRARAEGLDRLGVAVGSLGRTQSIIASSAAAALSAFSLPLISAIATGKTLAAGDGLQPVAQIHPVTLWGGALGAGCLLFYVGGVLQTSTKTANAVAADIVGRLGEQQGGSEGTQGGPSVVRLPSYRVSVQLASASATERLLPLTLAAVLTPLGLALALRAVYGRGGELITLQGLMAFAAVATLTGCYAALAAEGAETLLAHLRRRTPEGAQRESAGPAAEFIGRSVGPAALLGVKATVVAALVSGPLLFGN
jgi:K(+)-stimulated pyrophosphate-energized sodium pump